MKIPPDDMDDLAEAREKLNVLLETLTPLTAMTLISTKFTMLMLQCGLTLEQEADILGKIFETMQKTKIMIADDAEKKIKGNPENN